MLGQGGRDSWSGALLIEQKQWIGVKHQTVICSFVPWSICSCFLVLLIFSAYLMYFHFMRPTRSFNGVIWIGFELFSLAATLFLTYWVHLLAICTVSAIKRRIAHLQNQATVYSQVSHVKWFHLLEKVAHTQYLYVKMLGMVQQFIWGFCWFFPVCLFGCLFTLKTGEMLIHSRAVWSHCELCWRSACL